MARRARRKTVVRAGAVDDASADRQFLQATRLLKQGRVAEAFRLFLAAAKEGDIRAQMSVGYLYDTGQGVSPSRAQAMSWYRKAARGGKAAAATNIGAIYRDEGRLRLALRWFEKAVALGDADAMLEMAMLQAGPLKDVASARRLLTKVRSSKRVTADSQERAERLLRDLGPSPRRARTARRR